jgi:serine/threonine protein kinase
MTSARPCFETIKSLTAAKNGGNNQGIFLVKSKRSGNVYIEKRISQQHVQDEYATREKDALRQCGDHPNIVSLICYDFDCSILGYGSIYMEQYELGSLDGLITRYSQHGKLLDDEGFLYKVLWDVGHALNYLIIGTDNATARRLVIEGKEILRCAGWNRIVHRNLKPGNMFLTWKNPAGYDKVNYPTVVLVDFGCNATDADAVAGHANAQFQSGLTPSFAPPESPKYHLRTDIYMLGLTIHCLTVMSNVPHQNIAFRDAYPMGGLFNDELLEQVVRDCLIHDPDKRGGQRDLPRRVWFAYLKWRKYRKDDGKKLPDWAFT